MLARIENSTALSILSRSPATHVDFKKIHTFTLLPLQFAKKKEVTAKLSWVLSHNGFIFKTICLKQKQFIQDIMKIKWQVGNIDDAKKSHKK